MSSPCGCGSRGATGVRTIVPTILVLTRRLFGLSLSFLALTPAAAQAEGSPSAAEFVNLLEQHDFWRRTSESREDRMPLPILRELAAVPSELAALVGYDCIHVVRNRRSTMAPSLFSSECWNKHPSIPAESTVGGDPGLSRRWRGCLRQLASPVILTRSYP